MAAVLGGDALEGFRRANPAYVLNFPADHGPHPAFRSEWWYLTLMLEGDDGREYGGQFTLFRQAMEPPPETPAGAEPQPFSSWDTRQLYMAHLAVSDVGAGKHRSAERFSRGHSELAAVSAFPFRAFIDDWRLEALGDGTAGFPWQLTARADDFSWNLRIEDGRPLVLQGEAGYSAKGPGQASHYYSYSRLPVSGQLVVDGRSIRVSGNGWFDREWSTSVLGASQTGWAWLALQLDDGRDLMAFRLKRDDCRRDPFDHGLIVAQDGSTALLNSDDFSLEPIRWWEDGEPAQDIDRCAGDRAGWPVGWLLTLGTERFRIDAAFDQQLMRTRVRYWEGLVRVSQNDASVGRGYLELTGY
ncbi:MAG: lipocalin-like domain-containing protein [Pseudomonadota bacterium]